MTEHITALEYQNTYGKGKGKGKAPVKRTGMKFRKPEEAGKKDIRMGLELLVAARRIPGYATEHRFHKTRKWRFDYAIPAMMIAIEYEGIHSRKSGHTTVTGYNKDVQKYNAATVLGWRILRYTANTYKDFTTDILNILEG